MVPADSGRVPRAPPYSGSASPPKPFAYGALTLCGRPSNAVRPRLLAGFNGGPTTPSLGTVWAAPLSLAATHGIAFAFFSSGYSDVSIPRVALARTVFVHPWMPPHFLGGGLPHSDTPGSLAACTSPGRFAARRVLRLLRMPRHPPYALLRLFARELLSPAFAGEIFSFRLFGKSISVFPVSSGFQRPRAPFGALRRAGGSRRRTNSILLFLLRKEVIHPHVLVGIPCYDLTPIASPAFDGSPPPG